METINIINGNGEASKEKLNVLLDAALKFYGTKYEQVVLDVIKEAYFYEWSGEESIKDIIEYIIERPLSDSDIRGSALGCSKEKAFYYLHKVGNHYNQIIISKPQLQDNDYHIFAHELFGHAVCGKVSPIIHRKGKVYQRNGIAICDDQRSFNDIINEGFMESIASSIINIERKIIDYPSQNFELSKYCGDHIFDILGKETVLDSLVFNQGNLPRKYNFKSTRNEWKHLNNSLERELIFRNIFPIKCKPLITEVEKNIDNFQKRITRS